LEVALKVYIQEEKRAPVTANSLKKNVGKCRDFNEEIIYIFVGRSKLLKHTWKITSHVKEWSWEGEIFRDKRGPNHTLNNGGWGGERGKYTLIISIIRVFNVKDPRLGKSVGGL